jgi:hypothetical protein
LAQNQHQTSPADHINSAGIAEMKNSDWSLRSWPQGQGRKAKSQWPKVTDFTKS